MEINFKSPIISTVFHLVKLKWTYTTLFVMNLLVTVYFPINKPCLRLVLGF